MCACSNRTASGRGLINMARGFAAKVTDTFSALLIEVQSKAAAKHGLFCRHDQKRPIGKLSSACLCFLASLRALHVDRVLYRIICN